MRRFAPGASGRSASKPERKDYFEQFSPEARQILDELLEKYAEHGDAQFVLPDVLEGSADLNPRPARRNHQACSAAPTNFGRP